MSKMEPGLYQLLQQILKDSDHPMTCVELYERADVRALAHSSNRVSDYLGGLWRKGDAARLPFQRTASDASRWAYAWRARAAAPASTGYSLPAHLAGGQTLVDKPHVRITEDHDTITIELPKFSVTIKSR